MTPSESRVTRHASPLSYFAVSVQLPAEPSEWICIATDGKWSGYRDGERELTPADFEAAVAHFDDVNKANNSDLLIDYGHASILAAAGKLNPRDVDAAGWISELDLRYDKGSGAIFAKPTWTPAALGKIQEREQRYVSPAFFFNVPHPVTGKPVRCVLHSVALTNTPFFRHLPAVAASDLFQQPHTRPSAFRGFALDYLALQAKPISIVASPPYEHEHACSVAEIPEGDECRTKELTAGISIIICRSKEADEWYEASYRFDADRYTAEQARTWLAEHKIEGEFHPASTEATDMDPKAIAKLLGLADDATEEQITQKIEGLVANANAAPLAVAPDVAELLGIEADAEFAAVEAAIRGQRSEASDQTDDRVLVVAASLGLDSSATAPELLAAIEGVKGKATVDEAEKLVAGAVADRKIPPADKEKWLKMARTDLATAQAIIASLTPILGAGGTQPPPDDGTPELTPEDRQVADQLGVKHEELAATKAMHSA